MCFYTEAAGGSGSETAKGAAEDTNGKNEKEKGQSEAVARPTTGYLYIFFL